MRCLFGKRVTGLVSVVIPSYNCDKYICQALDGLKDQTYKNIEVIIIDDCSKDDTENVVKDWRKNNSEVFKNFIYLKLPRNRDEEWANNIGFFMSSGEYIALQYSDDACHKEKIQRQVDFLLDNAETASVGVNYKVFIDDLNNIIHTASWLCFDRNRIEEIYKKGGHCICTGTTLFRAHILEDIIGFKKVAYGNNDWFFITECISHDFIVDNLSEVLYYLRGHEKRKTIYMHDKAVVAEKMKQIKGRVSVVLPVYRKQNDILSALKSVLDQTYGNIEVIIVDDSNDMNLEEEIKKCYLQYSSNNNIKDFIYFKLPRKVGYPWIYNIGAYLSMGEFIAFHGDNGLSHKERLAKQVAFLRDNFLYSVVGTNFQNSNDWIKYDDEIGYSYIVEYKPCVNLNTILLRTDIINKTGGLNQSIPGREQFVFIENLIRSNEQVQNLRDILYYEN